MESGGLVHIVTAKNIRWLHTSTREVRRSRQWTRIAGGANYCRFCMRTRTSSATMSLLASTFGRARANNPWTNNDCWKRAKHGTGLMDVHHAMRNAVSHKTGVKIDSSGATMEVQETIFQSAPAHRACSCCPARSTPVVPLTSHTAGQEGKGRRERHVTLCFLVLWMFCIVFGKGRPPEGLCVKTEETP
jgi:hypothetical protein